MADKKSSASKTAPAAEKSSKLATLSNPVQVACLQAGFNYKALSEEVTKELETVAKSLDKLGEYFSPEILSTLTSSLVTSGSISVTIIQPVAKPSPAKE